jgi:glycosyltransferase involved in cell wall biosynthesis
MSVRISVVVPTYRRPELLERCVAALVAQDYPREAFEVIVADDGAEDRVRRMTHHWALLTQGAPMIRYVGVTATQGPAGARNRGWEQARGEVVAFTDDDTVPHADWLTEGWEAMRTGASAASGHTHVPLGVGRPTDREKDMARMSEAEFITANCFVRRETLAAIGGFDERFTSAWREDSDLQFTLLERCGTIVPAKRAVVEHPVRPDGWMGNVRAHRKIAFDALLFRKHPRLYREHIRRSPPWNYYAIVAALFAWIVLTAQFTLMRLKGTSHAPRHVAEMIATSILIPPVAVFWRLMGALRFRVLFM